MTQIVFLDIWEINASSANEKDIQESVVVFVFGHNRYEEISVLFLQPLEQGRSFTGNFRSIIPLNYVIVSKIDKGI
ncbi:hypothetical protein DICVIV_06330 [Dictyocaulus viviparus]|uniref:Uncharacterized protein n=1 Tax=Dictyocaulus viviparus TaxID=29172 RepID=A0A0D8XSE7_DICVI|nr:hypothetical protein DICVIV_06330 [Dictyocaulus viviparus]